MIGFAGAAGVGLAVSGIKSAVKAGSDLTESMNAVHVVFRKATPQVTAFTKSATKFGLSMREANELITPIGAALTNYGFSADQAAKQSIELTKRAADMASVFNTSVPDALEAIQAGLRGESDPLERFGVGLNDAAVKAKGVEMGFKLVKGQLDNNAKAQARIALLMEQTNKVQGDFANTSGGLANQQRILSAEFENLQAKVGQALIPVLLEMLKVFREDVIPAIKTTIQVVKENWPVVGATIKQNWEQSIKPSLRSMIATFHELVEAVRVNWPTLGPIVKGVATIVQIQIRAMTAVLRGLAALLRGDWSEAWNQYKIAVGQAVHFVQAQVQVVARAADAIGNAIWHGIVAGISAGFKAVKNAVTGLFDKVIGWAKDALGIGSPSKVLHDSGLNAVRGFANGIGAGAGLLKKAVLNVVKSLPAKALGGLEGMIPGIGKGTSDVKRGPGGSTLGTLVPWANAEGMTITSTTGGNHVSGSYHYQGRAIDVAGSASQMRKFFFDSLQHFGVAQIKELFYDPVGEYVDNGRIHSGSIGGHSDHVHLALAKGGIVTRPTTALIGERGPEAVIPLSRGGGTMQVNLQLDGKTLASVLIDPLRGQAQLIQQRTGRPVFG